MKALLPAVLAGCVLASASHAQDNKELAAPEVVVTATRFEEPAGKEPIGVTIITATDIEQSGATNLPQLLSRYSGIGTRDSAGSPDVQIDMRGFGATGDQNAVVLLDGIRMNENELTTIKWSSVPLESIERVEILRGSGAVLYGSGATGGVINIITKTPKAGDRSASVAVRGGSYDAAGVAASGSLAGETLGLRIGTRYDETDNYRDHNALRQRNVDFTVRTLGEGPSVTFSGGAEAQDLELPGALSRAQIQADRRAVNPFSIADFADRKSEYVRLTGMLPVGRGEFAMDFGYRHKDIDAFLFTPVQTSTRTWSVSPRLRLPYDALGASHSLVVGIDFEDWNYDSLRQDPFTPVHIVADQSNSALYLQQTTDFLTGTRFSIGGRAQNSTSHASDVNNPAPYAADEQDVDPRAYEIAVRQQLGANLSAYAKVGYSFRVPTLDESFAQFGGPFFDSTVDFLDPQTSHDREIGMQFSHAGLQGRVALFQMDLKNEIHFNPTTFTNINLPPTRRNGFEVDLSKTLTDYVDASVSYTYTDAKFREGSLNGVDLTGYKLPLAPRHRASVGVNARLGERTRLNVAATYTGEQYFDNDETNTFGEKMPAYTVVDVRFGHRIDQWTFSLVVNNLFDEDYFSYAVRSLTTSNYNAYPQPERNFLAMVEYRFGQ